MVLVKAGPAEILRSSQKDELAIGKLQKLCEDVSLSLLGPRLLIKYKKAIQGIGQLLYFGNTTLLGFQTLGEEYTGILQVDDTFQSVPSILTRILMILLQCYGSELTILFISELEKNIKQNPELLTEQKNKFLRWLALMRILLPSVTLLHKAIFYYSWGTYHFSKRITGVNYVLIRYWLKDRKSLFGFRILGIISVINFILHTWQSISNYRKKDHELTSSDEIEIFTTYGTVSTKKCIMCLNRLRNPTATMCGHIYCWSCIAEWAQNQDKCPVCRETIQPSRLIPLHNYV
ncbi:peroxisome biogenesis factor 10 [Halyomorpha halys]|uniref:peroxisome biogenesis factor 10 n=1 Tax=Halyomorpha halys TaxID=286706 RepID=UPI0006D51BCD|nr:peroxisome biogenesis factor 10 [Halyomorpha halys]